MLFSRRNKFINVYRGINSLFKNKKGIMYLSYISYGQSLNTLIVVFYVDDIYNIVFVISDTIIVYGSVCMYGRNTSTKSVQQLS